MSKRASLPATLLDGHVFETIGKLFDKFVAQARAKDSHRLRQGWIKKLVCEGRVPLRRAIEWTGDKDGAIDADAALRDIAEAMFEQGEELPKLLTAYLISHPKPARGRGRSERDTWLRDQCVAVCVGIARERWSAVIPLTRNEETSAPSLCSVVSQVCHSRGIPISEKRVHQIYQRYAEFLPVHQGWLAIKSSSPI